jgi:uncharacterized membrane protein
MSGVIVIAPLVALLAIAWVTLLVTAPSLPAEAAAFLYVLCSRICHQIAERSFHVDGAQLPVCARCTGIHIGLALGALYATFTTCPALRRVLVIGALPTLVTVLAEWAGLWQTSNAARAIAGAPLGIAVGLVVMLAARDRHLAHHNSQIANGDGLHYGECAPRPPIARDRPPSHI